MDTDTIFFTGSSVIFIFMCDLGSCRKYESDDSDHDHDDEVV